MKGETRASIVQPLKKYTFGLCLGKREEKRENVQKKHTMTVMFQRYMTLFVFRMEREKRKKVC